MKLAAQAAPNDLTGTPFSEHCDGREGDTTLAERLEEYPDATIDEHQLARLNMLLSRRKDLVPVLDEVFAAEGLEKDELRTFLAEMVPLYDPPSLLLPSVTRQASELMRQLSDPDDKVAKAAVEAFARMRWRDGYRSITEALGLARTLAYPELDSAVDAFLGSIADDKDGFARKEWEELLRAASVDLATADIVEPNLEDPGTLTVARQLLFAKDEGFSGGKGPKWVTERDYRGLAKAQLIDGAVPAPFVNEDGDNLADVNSTGQLIARSLPSSFLTLPERLAGKDAAPHRDGFGRAKRTACSPASGDDGETCEQDYFYSYLDADQTLLAGLSRELGPFLRPEGAKGEKLVAPALYELVHGLNAIVGPFGKRKWKVGDQEFDYIGPDTRKSAFFDLVYAFSNILPFKETEQLLQVFKILITEHEQEIAGLVEAGLYIDARADSSDAHWEPGHEFWDHMLAFGQDVLRRPGLVEGIFRVLATVPASQSGSLIGNFMRFKDRVAYPNGDDETLTALGIDPETVHTRLDDNAVADAVQANRPDLNYPCEPPATSLFGTEPEGPEYEGCSPLTPHPAKNHKGIPPPTPNPRGLTHGCPDKRPSHGASCANLPAVGLCSYDAGSCVCDCEGGLCRHGAKPTWRCVDEVGETLPSVPGYEIWVDRSQPDVRAGGGDFSNLSLFYRSIQMVYDIHIPAKLCNKTNAVMNIYTPGGGNRDDKPLGDLFQNEAVKDVLGLLLGETFAGVFGPYKECDLVEERNISQLTARAILGKAVFPIKPDILTGLFEIIDVFNLGSVGLSADAILQRQSQIRGFGYGGDALRASAVTRVVFGPMNPFQADLLDPVLTRFGEPAVRVHSETMYAWELNDPVENFFEKLNGRRDENIHVSYFDVLKPLLTTMDELELRPEGEPDLLAPGEEYLFGKLIATVYKHWPSRESDVSARVCSDAKPVTCQDGSECSPDDFDCLESKTAPFFAYQSNGVSYEELAAETLVDAQMLRRVRDVIVALDEIEITDTNGDQIDGIEVAARAVEKLLDPEQSCLEADCTKHPDTILKTRQGSKTTKTAGGHDIKVTPMHLLLDALNALDASFEGENKERLKPWRQMRSTLVDLLLEVNRTAPEEWYFVNPRSKPLLLTTLDFLSRQIGRYRTQQDDCLDEGGSVESCQQLRDWSLSLVPRLEKSVSQPVTAATLRFLDRGWQHPTDPAGKVLKLFDWMFDEDAKAGDAYDTSLVAVHDLIQLFDDSRNVAPIMRFLGRAVAPDAQDYVDGKPGEDGKPPALEVGDGALEHTLKLFRALISLDSNDSKVSTMTQIARRLVKANKTTGEAPIELILDTIAEVNRVRPGVDEGKPLDAEDLRSVLNESQEFLSDRRHGLERLYEILQARELP